MQLDDLVVEVRDLNLNPLGMLTPGSYELEAAPVLNGVGVWKVTLPLGHPLADALKTPGAGIIITGPDDVIASGPVTADESTVSVDDIGGSIVLSGVFDEQLLYDRLAYPQPSNIDTRTQSVDFDIRTGSAELVMHQYVEANVGPLAPVGRRETALQLNRSSSAGAGPTITKQARFENLGELTAGIATSAGLAQRVVQVADSVLSYETRACLDRSNEIRLDIRNGTLDSHKVSVNAPTMTHAIVGAGYDPTDPNSVPLDRMYATVTTPESLAASDQWQRRVEVFVDQAYEPDEDVWTQSAIEQLKENGLVAVAAQLVAGDDTNMRYGRDWNIGDTVSVVVDDTEVKTQVTGLVLKVDGEGVRMGFVLGDASKLDPQAYLGAQVSATQSRVNALELSQSASPFNAYVAFSRASGSLVLSTTKTTVPGTINTVTCPGPTAVYMVTGTFDMQVTTAGSSTGLGETMIDGAVLASEALFMNSTSTARATVAQTWIVTGLAAGARTFSLCASRTNSTGALTLNATHTTMTILRVA